LGGFEVGDVAENALLVDGIAGLDPVAVTPGGTGEPAHARAMVVRGFHAAEPTQFPRAGGDFLDQQGLLGGFRLPVFKQRGQESFGVFGAFAQFGDDERGGYVCAVGEGVSAGSGFAVRSARPGGTAGITAIGIALLVGDQHTKPESRGRLEGRTDRCRDPVGAVGEIKLACL
jgi:hypothetical protein